MNEHGQKTVYFVTGASGVGKTVLLEALNNKYRGRGWVFLHFDSTGVPSPELMIKEFGSPSGWQKAKTFEWVDRIIHEYREEKIFLEGQVNLEFIEAAFRKNAFENYKIALLDCNESEMAHRLTEKRNQPELVNDSMKNWLQFLRTQASTMNIPVIDTSGLSTQEMLNRYEKIIGLS